MNKTLLAVILIIISITGFFMWVNPHYGNIKTLKATLAESNDALANAQQLDTLRRSLVDQENAFKPTDLAKLKKMLPASVDSVRLTIDMQGIATHYGLTLKNIAMGVAQTSTGSGSAIGPSSKQYGSIPLSFSVTASYDNLIAFLKGLESSLRVLEIRSLSFSADDTKPGTYNVSMSIDAFWLSSQTSTVKS